MSQFHVQGPVPLGADARIEFQFETRVIQEVIAGRWTLLLGPRQHGKTTGLLRVRADLQRAGIPTAYVDLMRLPPLPTYEAMLEWFVGRVASNLALAGYARPHRPDDAELMMWLENVIPAGNDPITLIIDEAASIGNSEWRNSFYGQIRSIANARAEAEGLASRLRFIFSGTFRPETLVDQRNSPFNVCQLVETEDLSIDEARNLAQRVDAELVPFAEQAYDLVGGQPYLLQVVLSAVQSVETAERIQTFESTIAGLRRGDNAHFEGVFSKVFDDRNLVGIVARMVQTGDVANEPANSDFKYLQVIGIAQRNGDRLVFRNNIYAELARNSPQLALGAAPAAVAANLFVLPDTNYDFMRNPELREFVRSAYTGAVHAYNVGSYRLALVGFGCALEGLLLDWFLAMAGPDRTNKIAHINLESGEITNNPRTWRLFTLMRAARSNPLRVQVGDPQDSLRNWRNLAHPSVAIRNYRTEVQLEPEGRTASGLLCSLLRDIAPLYPP